MEEAEEPVADAVVDPEEPVAALPDVEAATMPPVVLPALFVAALLKEAPLVAVAKKRELMQEDWQDAYCSVSAAVPLPCGH